MLFIEYKLIQNKNILINLIKLDFIIFNKNEIKNRKVSIRNLE